MSQSAGNHRGAVRAIHLNIRTRQAMRQVSEVMAVPGAGLMGCRHSKPGNERAVLLVEAETLDDLGLAPGEIKENVTTSKIDLRALKPGATIQVGETVVLEVTGPCAPCRRMDEIRPGLKDQLAGRRGINTRVQIGGKIHAGDEIVVLHAGRLLP